MHIAFGAETLQNFAGFRGETLRFGQKGAPKFGAPFVGFGPETLQNFGVLCPAIFGAETFGAGLPLRAAAPPVLGWACLRVGPMGRRPTGTRVGPGHRVAAPHVGRPLNRVLQFIGSVT